MEFDNISTGTPGKSDIISSLKPVANDVKKPKEEPRKFHNGWTKELEDLIADWGDKALVYRWLHETTSSLFKRYDQLLIIPVIIMSTLSGTANFGMGSFFGTNTQGERYAQLGVGGVSIIAGILTTLSNYYSYSKCAETHRTSAVSWGKFNRLISIELRLHPDERIDSKSFLKMFRIELDRLIEQAPTIPDSVIEKFKILFEDSDVRLPDILGVMEHMKVFTDSNSRLKKLAAEATIMIHQKKGILKQLVLSDLDEHIRKIITEDALVPVSLSLPPQQQQELNPNPNPNPTSRKDMFPVNEVVVKS